MIRLMVDADQPVKLRGSSNNPSDFGSGARSPGMNLCCILKKLPNVGIVVVKLPRPDPKSRRLIPDDELASAIIQTAIHGIYYHQMSFEDRPRLHGLEVRNIPIPHPDALSVSPVVRNTLPGLEYLFLQFQPHSLRIHGTVSGFDLVSMPPLCVDNLQNWLSLGQSKLRRLHLHFDGSQGIFPKIDLRLTTFSNLTELTVRGLAFCHDGNLRWMVQQSKYRLRSLTLLDCSIVTGLITHMELDTDNQPVVL